MKRKHPRKPKEPVKSDKRIFFAFVLSDFCLLVFFAYITFVLFSLYTNSKHAIIVSTVFLLIVFAFFTFIFLRALKRRLETVAYTYENSYLFKKYIFLYDSLIIVSLSFLLGVNSSWLSLLDINDKIFEFYLNACLFAASSIATSTKATLSYTYVIWDSNRKKEGKPLVDTASSVAKEKKQSNMKFLSYLQSKLPFGQHRK